MINEQSFVAKLRSQQIEYFGLLYDKYSSALYGLIVRMVKDAEQSEEILHDSLLKIWKNIETYDADKGRLYTWMARICKNASLDYLKSKACTKSQKTDEIQPMYSTRYGSMHSSMFIDAIGIHGWLSDIEEKYQEVIEALYLKGLSQIQASEYLEIPLGTVKTRVRLGLIQLRQNLDIKIPA